jgi:hypothetical protein
LNKNFTEKLFKLELKTIKAFGHALGIVGKLSMMSRI